MSEHDATPEEVLGEHDATPEEIAESAEREARGAADVAWLESVFGFTKRDD